MKEFINSIIWGPNFKNLRVYFYILLFKVWDISLRPCELNFVWVWAKERYRKQHCSKCKSKIKIKMDRFVYFLSKARLTCFVCIRLQLDTPLTCSKQISEVFKCLRIEVLIFLSEFHSCIIDLISCPFPMT